MKAKLLRLFIVMTISITALYALRLTASAETYNINEGSVTISANGEHTITGDGSETTNTITVASGVSATITLENVNINVSNVSDACAFMIADGSTGDVTIKLAGTNSLRSGYQCAGLQKNDIADGIGKLTITGEGSLTVKGGSDGAGIGGGSGRSSCNIEFSGGEVNATGGENAAGIGGGKGANGSNITISGGTVTAAGSGDHLGFGGGAGIGGAREGVGSNITISGGTVTATGGAGGAGIGGGYFGSCGGNIVISGGSVKAVAGAKYPLDKDCYAAAIGGGVQSDYTNGAAVIPTNGTDPVYLLEMDVNGTDDVTIDGNSYPKAHLAESKLYAYLAEGEHTIAKNGETTTVTYSKTGDNYLDTYGSFAVTGEDLVLGTDYTFLKATGALSVNTEKPITISGATTTYRIVVADGIAANITLNSVNIDVSDIGQAAAFEIAENSKGNVTITLVGDNTLTSGRDGAGLQKNGSAEDIGKLTITGEGSLTAQGGENGAGIGGGSGHNGSNITISGGTVTATGGDASSSGMGAGAGIGGHCNGSNITISGGTVKASGGNNNNTGKSYLSGAGIGGGGNLSNSSASNIIISGGSVEAIAGNGAAAIGYRNNSSVTPTVDGTNPVYLFEMEVDGTNDVTIDDKDYPETHFGGNTLYVYLPEGTHTITSNGTTQTKAYFKTDDNKLDTYGSELLITGEDLAYGTDYTYSADTGILTVSTAEAVTISGTTTTDRIMVASGVAANITLNGVDIQVTSGAAFEIAEGSTSTVTVTLAGDNRLKSGVDCAGIQKHGSGKLVITGAGALTAQGGSNGAGIGGGNSKASGNIDILGGSVKAVAGANANAIGGGYGKSAVAPTNGTSSVYLLELEVDGTNDVTIDGNSYPRKHFDENRLYVYLTGGEHNIAKNGTTTTDKYFKNAENKLEVYGSDLTVTGEGVVAGVDYTYFKSTGILNVLSGKAMTISGTTTTDRIVVADGIAANITLSGVDIQVMSGAAFEIAENSTSDVTVTLAGNNTLKSGAGCAGLQKNGSGEDIGKLTITGTGSLTATGGDYGAGIGGGSGNNGSNITISGGTITATGGMGGAGIGGGYGKSAEVPTNGTANVYLFELEVDGTNEVTIDGNSYPKKHFDENKLYVYLTEGTHTVTKNGVTTTEEYHKNEEGNEGGNEGGGDVEYGSDLTVTGEGVVAGVDYTYLKSTGFLTVLTGKPMTISGTTVIDRIVVADGVPANITLTA